MRAFDLLHYAHSVPALSVRALRKSFARGLARAHGRTFALRDVDITVSPGEVVCLAGDEGAGKTALLQCMAGLLKADSGSVTWFGERILPGVIPQGVAYVPAVPVYYPFLSVRDALQVRSRCVAGASALWSSLEAIALLQLDEKLDTLVADLSRAEVRCLSLAEAIIQNPAAILVDTSPSEGRSVSRAALGAIRGFAERGGAVIIGVRDAMTSAEAATRIIMLEQGVIRRTFCRDSTAPLSHRDPPLVLAETLH